jgi:hypothetical protein
MPDLTIDDIEQGGGKQNPQIGVGNKTTTLKLPKTSKKGGSRRGR